MTSTKPVSGTILAILDAGSVVVLRVGVNEGQIVSICFDATPFRWLLEGEGCDARQLIGRRIVCDGESVAFLDRKESDDE